MKNRIFALLVSLVIFFGILPPQAVLFAEESEIKIGSTDEFLQLAKNCESDAYSKGKTVRLTADIDFTGKVFKPIPSFSGSFDGQNHKIRGINYKKSGKAQGVFRYIEVGGEVKNLGVSATVRSKGSGKYAGGIVGVNSGTVTNCTFSGTVYGKSNVGGIAGVCESTGKIINSASSGTVYGEHYIGGIVGQNLGSVVLCTNRASVNTTEEDIKLDIDNINFDKLISAENMDDYTDIGGVCGFSAGVLQSCENYGTVGCERIGYNIGGIVGRQRGYVGNCENHGKIYGRKDIGGICGQTEPYTTLVYSKSALENLSDRLDALNSAVNNTIADSRYSKSLISANLDAIRGNIDKSRGLTEDMMKLAEDKANNGIDKINDSTAKIAKMTDELLTISDDISVSVDNLGDIADDYREKFDELYKEFAGISPKQIDKAFVNLSNGAADLARATVSVRKSIDSFKSVIGDRTEMQKALANIKNAMADFSAANAKIGAASGDISEQLKILIDKAVSGTIQIPDDLLAAIRACADSAQLIADAAKLMASGAGSIGAAAGNIKTALGKGDPDGITDGLHHADRALDDLVSAMQSISLGMGNLKSVWRDVKESIENAKDIREDMVKITDRLQSETEKMSDKFDSMRAVIRNYLSDPLITLDNIGSDYYEKKDDLLSSLTDMQNSVSALRGTASSFGDTILNDFQNITDIMDRIADDLSQDIDDAKEKDELEDFFKDISDGDGGGFGLGKVVASKNSGKVNGDLNVGGIAGSMAIEYDFDPEDDSEVQGEKSFNFVYNAKSVLAGCKNTGNVTARKNRVGGIVGKEDLGTVVNCIGSGVIKSSSGSYAGGIVGESDSVIRMCYAKATVSGKKNVGGIAGKGKDIYNSAALVKINKANENRGAIAGEVSGNCVGNFFTSEKDGGVDGISYTGSAESLSYNELISLPGIPEEFKSFELRFVNKGQTVDKVKFSYGQTLKKEDIPSVPKKKGYYGKWNIESFENLTYDATVKAVYKKYITAIETSQKRGKTALAVAEGEFSSDAKLSLENRKDVPKLKIYQTSAECYNVKLSGDDKKISKIHFIPKGDSLNVSVMVFSGDKWQSAKTSEDGSYIVFAADKSVSAFCVVRSSRWLMSIFGIALAVILLILLFIIIKIIRRKKGKIKIGKRLILEAIGLLIAAVLIILVFLLKIK